MHSTNPTFVGQVASVVSGKVRVKLNINMPSTLITVNGVSYRVGQIGSYFRIPLGYTNLYAVCTEVGADAVPSTGSNSIVPTNDKKELGENLTGYRWMTIVLFGEGVGSNFERGVGQYPTVGDEVHLVTDEDLKIIYEQSDDKGGTIPVGSIASATGISANINLANLVSRHCAIVGSTGAGKSNLVTILIDAVSERERFPNARIIVIDPHGEYTTAFGDKAQVFKINPDHSKNEKSLYIPFWTLPISEILNIAFDIKTTHSGHEAKAEVIREKIFTLKKKTAQKMMGEESHKKITADVPLPFYINGLWYDLDRYEKTTYKNREHTKENEALKKEGEGSAAELISAVFEPAGAGSSPPFLGKRNGIQRNLDFMLSRLQDTRYSFLFEPGDELNPNSEGDIGKDLNELVSQWVGNEKPISVFDVSGLPSEILPTIVGTMLRVIYDMLFWAQGLPISGKEQPLLVVIEEAHRFLSETGNTPAHRTLSMIAKEGRKYGIGLTLVSQRPSEIDNTILSQAGSFVAMRLTNESDQSKVKTSVPDDLGGLIGLLPSLRTGEALFIGEIMPIPSRVRVQKAKEKTLGDDPKLPESWQIKPRPRRELYEKALSNWRKQSFFSDETN